jgi:hypothetical protein
MEDRRPKSEDWRPVKDGMMEWGEEREPFWGFVVWVSFYGK